MGEGSPEMEYGQTIYLSYFQSGDPHGAPTTKASLPHLRMTFFIRLDNLCNNGKATKKKIR